MNLAVSLANTLGLRVGLLDADVFGPSIPRMMKLHGRPALGAGQSPAPHTISSRPDHASKAGLFWLSPSAIAGNSCSVTDMHIAVAYESQWSVWGAIAVTNVSQTLSRSVCSC